MENKVLEITNENNKENIVKWLTEKADILPTKASIYADLVIKSGVGSISRISKKLSKNENYLIDIGIDPDDAEEITSALLKYKNVERSEIMKKNASTNSKSNITPSISYQPLQTQSSSSTLTSSLSSSSTTTTLQQSQQSQQVSSPPSFNPQLNTSRSEIMPNISTLPAAYDNKPHGIGHRRTATDISRNLSALSLEINNVTKRWGPHSSINAGDLETARPSSLRISSNNININNNNYNNSNNFGGLKSSTSSGNLQSLNSMNNLDFKSPNNYDNNLTNLNHNIKNTTARLSESLSFSGPSNIGNNNGVGINGSSSSSTTTTTLTSSIPQTNYLGPASSSHLQKQQQFHNHHRSSSLGADVSDAFGKASVLDPLRKFDPRAVRTGTNAQGTTIYMSREQMEISALCTSLAGEFRTAVENRTSQSHCNTVLARVIKQAPEDKKMYVECLGQTGVCQNISMILSTYPDSEDICLNCCNVISLLCQYSDKRDSLNENNIKAFEEHGVTILVLQILTTFRNNPHLIEKASLTLAKLANNEQNITTLTHAGACENLLGLLSEIQPGKVLIEVLHAIRNIAQRDESVRYMIQCGMCEGLTHILSLYIKEDLTTQNILRTINMLCSLPEASKKFGEVDACNIIVKCLKTNSSNIPICEWGLMTISSFLSYEDNIQKLLDASVCEIIVTCLNQNIHTANIARGASRAIQLIANKNEIRTILGKVGACEVFPRALSNHINVPSTAQVCCGAIGTLAEGNDENKAKLTTAGACEVLINTMQKYSTGDAFMNTLPSGSELVVWQACWALRKLAFGGVNRKRLESSSICEALNIVLSKHINIVDVVVQAFRAIHTLTTHRTHTIVAHMGTAGVCKSSVKAILKHPTNLIICKLGAEVICNLAECNENLEKLISAKACEAISSMITSHSSNDEILTEWACHAMYMLASYNETAATRIRTIGGIEAIVWALQRQMKHQTVAEWATSALNELVAYPANRSRVGSAGGCEAAISTAKRHAKIPSISQRTCRVINYLAMDANNRAWLGASGACAVVVKALEDHSLDHLVCAAACSAVASLACNHEGNNNRLRTANACERIIIAMKKHLPEADVSDEGCHAVYRLGEFSESIELLSNANAIGQVIECMLVHSDHRGVAKHSFQALYRLSDPKYSYNYVRLMAAKVNSALIKVMRSIAVTDNIDVCIEASKVIQNLACYSDNRLNLGQDGACDALVAILKPHMLQSDELVLEVSNAATQLSTDCLENTEKLIDAGLCESLVTCINHHKIHEATTAAICRCLVFLTKCHSAQAALTDYEHFRVFVKHLSRIKDDEVAVMWAFQLITSLCYDQRSCSTMGKANACKIITTAILQYRDSKTAVETGILTLSALSGVNEEPDFENLIRLSSTETCDAISLALKLHGNERTVADASFLLINRLTNIAKYEQLANNANSNNNNNDNNNNNNSSNTSSPSKLTGWNKLKSVILKSKDVIVDKTKPIVTQVQNHINHTVAHNAHTFSFSPEELAAKHHIRLRLGTSGVCEGLIYSMYSNIDNELTTLKACEALYNLSLEEDNLESIIRSNGTEVLVSILKMYAGRLESLVVYITLIIDSLISASFRNKISNPQIGIDFGNFGVCEIIGMTLFLYSDNAETVEAICRATNQLAKSSISNQTAFGNADAAHGLMDILSKHGKNPTVVSSATSTICSILKRHGENVSKFVFAANAEVITSLLRTWITDTEIVCNLLWLLKVLGPLNINTTSSSIPSSSSSSSSSITFGLSSKRRMIFANTWNENIHSTILTAFATHATTDSRVCQYGSEAINVILEPIPYQETFLRSNNDVDSCLYFGAAGLNDLAFSSLSIYLSNEEVLEPLIRTCALLTRRIDTYSLQYYRPSGVTKSHNNYKTTVPPSSSDVIFRILNKHYAHVGISRSAMFVLNNLLVDRDFRSLSISTNNLKTIIKAMNSIVSDPHGERYACNFITTLVSCDGTTQDKLINAGVTAIIVSSLQSHLTFPITVHDSCVAIATICKGNLPAKERFVSGGVCEALSDAFAAYSLNENIAVEICRATTILLEDAPQICSRFSSTDIGEHLLNLLRSFGCGETDRSATVAELCCRSIAEISLAPNTENSINWGIQIGNLGGCEALILVLEKYSTREEVSYQACKAILNLSKTDANLSKLHNAGAVRILTNTSKQFRTSGKIETAVKQVLERLKFSGPNFLT